MAWQEVTKVLLREEFVRLAKKSEHKISELCRRFGISRKTGYKWINRFRQTSSLNDRSRKPLRSPNKTNPEIEQEILAIRKEHPAWGGRKIRRVMQKRPRMVPAASTITAVLRRNELISKETSQKHTPFVRFERTAPNDLWQMDFKGHVPIRQGRCHPLTALDDYSRFAIVLKACANEQLETVRNALVEAFRKYGLPRQMIFDNGPPWGDAFTRGQYTRLTIWLIKLGIEISHSRPHHPQTMGKDERFHRTLKAELLGDYIPYDLPGCDKLFERWRYVYNYERPHDALDLEVPASRFTVSPRIYPEKEPHYEYAPADFVRKVQVGGVITYQGKDFKISKALRGEFVAVRPHPNKDGVIDIFFIKKRIARIDFRNKQNYEND